MVSLLITAAVPAAAFADTPAHPKNASTQTTAKKMTIKVKSTAFAANQAIPSEYTCDGAETSPPLSWSNVPKGAKSVAILVEDPDAPKGTFTHWLVTDLPPTATSLPAGGALPEGAMAAKNDKGNTSYAGPCPPTGRHHYHFRVYALDTTISNPTTKSEFLSAIDGHVLGQGELVGTYHKQGTH